MNEQQAAYIDYYLQKYNATSSVIFPLDIFVKHFNQFKNAVDSGGNKNFTSSYYPRTIEIYYGTASVPHILIENSQIVEFNPPESVSDSITVIIDEYFAYIEVCGTVIFNKISNLVLPDILNDPATMLTSLTKV